MNDLLQGRASAQEPGVEDRYRRVLEGLLGVPATEGNLVDVLRNGDEIFPAMLDAIANAHSTVDLCTYVYWKGRIAHRFAGALSERAAAGVRVRVLLDAAGAYAMDSGLVQQMQDAGCVVEKFRSVTSVDSLAELNARTHRKVMICDEEVAFTGGVGIAQEWEGNARNPDEWRDTHIRVRGPAVDGLRAAFVSNWAETGHPLFDDRDRFPDQPQPGRSIVQVVRCPSVTGWSEMQTVVTALLKLARSHVHLTTAYFVPDGPLGEILCDAAGRGVKVDVLVPGEHIDKRVVQVAGEAEYEVLFDAGISVWRYQPTMLHAKVLTVDGILACVGSANFDPRSMGLNEEANLVVFDRDVTRALDEHFAEDLASAERVDPDEWRKRGPVKRAVEQVTSLFNGQL